jgi:D-alanyl-lipoteichoic acid acyltransferase DltB (MBOAT superfamily)
VPEVFNPARSQTFSRKTLDDPLPSRYHTALMETWHAIVQPILDTPWAEWTAFWTGRVFQGRFINIYFAPLLLLVAFIPRRWMFQGLAVMSMAFIAWALGPVFLAVYMLIVYGLYRMSQSCASQFERLEHRQPGPLGPAIVIITAAYYGYMAFRQIHLPEAVERWLLGTLDWTGPHAATYEPGRHAVRVLIGSAHWCGVAYLAMKAIHLMWELRRGSIPEHNRTWWRFLCWTTYAPSLIQGPLERYNDFMDQIENCRDRWRPSDLAAGLYRIGVGIAKRLVILWYLEPYLSRSFKETYWLHPEQLGYGHLWLGIYALVAVLYLDFSGYCDVAIGMARMTGYRMFENFNWPFLSPSLREFWRRWHMSLSFFLRDYVYIPLGGSRAHVYRNYILTFVVCGVWHEPPLLIGFWGLIMGGGLCINRIWHEWWHDPDRQNSRLRRTVAKLRLIGSPVSYVLGWFVTVNFFCLTLLVFFGGINGGWNVLRQMIYRPIQAILGG